MRTDEHYRGLDALRGLAAQVVLIAHANLFILSEPGPFLGWLARLAVIFFFVLSGFAIATTISRHIVTYGRWDWFDYALRRFARIYPPYCVAILSVAVVAALSWFGIPMLGISRSASTFNIDAISWVRALLFLYTGNDAITVVDIAIWSLRLEVALYALAAFVAAAWFARGIKLAALLACAAVLTALFCYRLSFMIPAIILFGCGAAAALSLAYLPNISTRWSCAGITAVLLLPLALPNLTDDSAASFIYQALLGVPIALSLMVLARLRSVDRLWWTRLAVASGSWSYTLYIMHSPILIGLRTLFRDNNPLAGGSVARIGMFIIYFVLTNAICWLIALAVEQPSYFARLIRKWTIPMIPVAPSKTVVVTDK